MQMLRLFEAMDWIIFGFSIVIEHRVIEMVLRKQKNYLRKNIIFVLFLFLGQSVTSRSQLYNIVVIYRVMNKDE